MTQQQHVLSEINARLAKANSECETWLAARAIDRFLEACSKVEALEIERAMIAKGASTAAFDKMHVPDRAEVMADLSIVYDGCRFYYYDAYRYDTLECAVDYAQLQRARAGPGQRKIPMPTLPISVKPSDSDRDLMGSEGVTFVNGMYSLGDYRYEALADALAYARLMRVSPVGGKQR